MSQAPSDKPALARPETLCLSPIAGPSPRRLRLSPFFGALAAVWSLAFLCAPLAAQPETAPPKPPGELILIPAGTFAMGQPVRSGDIESPLPHEVTLPAFAMARTHTTWSQWQTVRAWAITHGYPDLEGIGSGKAASHPVQMVSWYDAVKWCNARSEMEGLSPCYSLDEAGTILYRTGTVDVANLQVKWLASGYRLPTEAEWEYAARGGLRGSHFPWGDQIDQSRANYRDTSHDASGDTAPVGYHPAYNDGPLPYTSPVAAFAANGYGLHDMAGNAVHWCWDNHAEYSPLPQTSPSGPVEGDIRVLRGGSWASAAPTLAAAYRGNAPPYLRSGDIGFRCVRGSAGPTITSQPLSLAVLAGQAATLELAASGATSYQWFKNGIALAGATQPTLHLTSLGAADAGLYDALVTGTLADTLSLPIVVGPVPAAGHRTVGNVVTQPEWQDIRHSNGAIYDQFLLTGPAGTFTADPGEIARLSFLDENDSIVQVELSGAGAITVVLASPSGPLAPVRYDQPGIHYMKGQATLIVAGANETTHFTVYSVGSANNPGVTRPGESYAAWAEVAASGIITTNGRFGGIHQGNTAYSAAIGVTGIYAPHLLSMAGPVVLHDIQASGSAQPYLAFGPGAGIPVKIASGALAQPNGDSLTTQGLARLRMEAGQDSCGRLAPARAAAARLAGLDGADVTSRLIPRANTLKILVVEINPVLTTRNNVKASTLARWSDGLELVEELQSDLEESSHGLLKCEVVKWEYLNEFPTYKKDIRLSNGTTARRLDEATWIGICNSGNFATGSIGEFNFDYDYLLSKFDLVARRENQEFDQVWLLVVDPASTFEASMFGRSPYWVNGPGFARDCPNTAIMNLSIYRRDANIECFGHMYESILGKVFGTRTGHGCPPPSGYGALTLAEMNLYEKFTVNEAHFPELSAAGNVHFAPNSAADYDWRNPRFVVSTWIDWAENYPELTGQTKTTNFRDWIPVGKENESLRYHHRWWFSLMPHVSGITTEGFSNNWWTYLSTLDFVTELEVLIVGPSPITVGGEYRLDVLARFNSGKSVRNSEGAYVRSTNEKVVRVEAGRLHALAPGTARITAKMDGKEATVDVAVRSAATGND